jgi:hypothetical protein
MPNIDEHCKRTLKKYGVEGTDIHKWLDEPSRKYAGRHREFRHDTETIRLVGEIFGSKYGRRLAENIALDHIMADHEEEIKKRPMITVQFQKGEKPSVPCPYCGTLLKPSDQFCPHCHAPRKRIIEEFNRTYEMEKLKLQEKRKQLRKELKHDMELSKYSVQQKLHLHWLNRKLGEEDPVLDRMIQKDFEEHPEIKEQIERRARIEVQIVCAILALWLIPSVVLGVINFELGFGWFVAYIFAIGFVIFCGFVFASFSPPESKRIWFWLGVITGILFVLAVIINVYINP